MTFEESLAALFICVWVAILAGWAVKELWFRK